MSTYPPTQNRRPESADGEVRETYFQAMYVVFWKPIYFVLGLAHGLLGCWLINASTDDPVQYAYAIAFLIAAPLAYFELEWFARAMRWDSGPIVEWRDRTTLLVGVGYTIAMALAITLLISETNDRSRARQNAIDAEREQAQQRELMNSRSVKDGSEALDALRAAKQARGNKK